MKNYVVGFLFSEDLDTVVLIEKRRPDWQAGKLNGPGGHVEDGEHPQEAMKREFKEEAGEEIWNWNLFATITNEKDWTVWFYRSVVSQEIINKCSTQTDEKIIQVHLGTDDGDGVQNKLPSNVIDNLNWLIPLALSKDNSIPLYIKERTISNVRLV